MKGYYREAYGVYDALDKKAQDWIGLHYAEIRREVMDADALWLAIEAYKMMIGEVPSRSMEAGAEEYDQAILAQELVAGMKDEGR